jgi:hypothetical protein
MWQVQGQVQSPVRLVCSQPRARRNRSRVGSAIRCFLARLPAMAGVAGYGGVMALSLARPLMSRDVSGADAAR